MYARLGRRGGAGSPRAWAAGFSLHSKGVPLEAEVHFTCQREVLAGKVARADRDAAERILAAWPGAVSGSSPG